MNLEYTGYFTFKGQRDLLEVKGAEVLNSHDIILEIYDAEDGQTGILRGHMNDDGTIRGDFMNNVGEVSPFVLYKQQ